MSSTVVNKRGAQRQAVLKGAQIVFGQTVVDCLVLNVSETGARLRTAAAVELPQLVTLRFRGGAVFPAVRRWARGSEIGFSLESSGFLPEGPASLAWQAYEEIHACSVEELLKPLREKGYFDDVGLRSAAEEAEQGLRRLEAALAARARARSDGVEAQ